MSNLSRRNIIKAIAAAAGGVVLWWVHRETAGVFGQVTGGQSYLPLVNRNSSANPTAPTVTPTTTPTLGQTPPGYTVTPTGTATSTPVAGVSPTASPTPTGTSTLAQPGTATSTATGSPTPTSTATLTQPGTATSTATGSPTPTGTATLTQPGTATSTATGSPTPTGTATLAQPGTATSTATPTRTATLAPTSSATPTRTPTATALGPTSTATPTRTATVTRTVTPTNPPGSGPIVMHMHDTDATSWNFSSGWYGDYVNQSVVNGMTDQGLMQLTGQATIQAAWQALLPGYAPGSAVAIKVNFNNANQNGGCNATGNIIDALIEPVNALIRGMLLMGVQAQDVWVFDANRSMPTRFRSRCLYPGVRFFDGSCAEEATFDLNSPVTFQHPNLSPRALTDVIVNATYLINMPIIKDHGISGVTLGFKNHFGSIDLVQGPGDDNLHLYINPEDPLFSPTYNPMVDIWLNAHILNKTVLNVGDGLYGCLENTNDVPAPWESFGDDAPNSLFFSLDPVALDCVMHDILDADDSSHPQRGGGHTDDYLALAAQAGLGVFERGDPWGVGYTTIDYRKIEL